MHRCFVRALGLWMLATPHAFAAPADESPPTVSSCGGELKVASQVIDGHVLVDVHLSTLAPAKVVWAVMTDYTHATRFIRHLKRSDAVSTGPNSVRVWQTGRASWGPFGADVVTEYDVALQPDALTLEGRLRQGDVKDMWLRAALTPKPNLTALHYQNRVLPAFWMPLTMAEPMLAQRAKESFEDLLAEISRRAGHCIGTQLTTP